MDIDILTFLNKRGKQLHIYIDPVVHVRDRWIMEALLNINPACFKRPAEHKCVASNRINCQLVYNNNNNGHL